MRTRRTVSTQITNSLVVGGAALLATVVIAAFANPMPERITVGDIITFHPYPGPVAVGSIAADGRIAAHRPNTFGCIFDLDTLRRHGGSLVTEARLADEGQRYRVHWAGERTAADSGDCGPSADVILDRSDLTRLAAAANGLGNGVQAIGTGAIMGR